MMAGDVYNNLLQCITPGCLSYTLCCNLQLKPEFHSGIGVWLEFGCKPVLQNTSLVSTKHFTVLACMQALVQAYQIALVMGVI